LSKAYFYAISCRITKLSVVVYHVMAQCLTHLNEVTVIYFFVWLLLDIKEHFVQSISFMLFDAGSPCGTSWHLTMCHLL